MLQYRLQVSTFYDLINGPSAGAFLVGRTELSEISETGMPSGIVKWFNSSKGYGFIQPDGGGADVFVHISAVERAGLGNLSEGQRLSFDAQRDPKKGKSSAENLKAI
jgi:CspA family cold shock protein